MEMKTFPFSDCNVLVNISFTPSSHSYVSNKAKQSDPKNIKGISQGFQFKQTFWTVFQSMKDNSKICFWLPLFYIANICLIGKLHTKKRGKDMFMKVNNSIFVYFAV